jgi:hypothetical protein
MATSLHARISMIKMNVLLRINFTSSMFPLPPPIDYWSKLDSVIKKFIWGRKRPQIEYATLQRTKASGGLICLDPL